MILDTILNHLTKRRHSEVYLFQSVVDVRAESNSARRRSGDPVLGVQRFINLLVVNPFKTDHTHTGAQLRPGGSTQPGAGNLADAFFQGRGQLADARLDSVASDQVMKVRRGSHRRYGGVIALSQRLEFARPARRRFDLGAPSHADDAGPDFGDAVMPDVKLASLLRPHKPFVRAGGVRVASHLAQIERERAECLSPVHVRVDASFARHSARLFARQPHAGRTGYIGERQDSGFGRDRRAESLQYLFDVACGLRNADALYREAGASGAHVPGDIVGRMILIEDHHFVARFQPEAVDDEVIRLAGVSDDGDLVLRSAHESRELPARLFQQRIELGAILERDVGVQILGQTKDSVSDHMRRRTEVRCVQQGDPGFDREMLFHQTPERLARAIGGAETIGRARQRAGGAGRGEDRERGRASGETSEKRPAGCSRMNLILACLLAHTSPPFRFGESARFIPSSRSRPNSIAHWPPSSMTQTRPQSLWSNYS